MAKKEKPKKNQLEQGEKKKKSPLKLIIIILVVVLVLAAAAGAAVYFLFLREEGYKDPEPKELTKAPAVYAAGADEVVSLDSIMDEGAAVLTTVEAPTRAAEEAGVDERTYRYKEAEDPQDLAEDYIKVLLGEEQGFTFTDIDNQMLAEEPDLKREAGSVILAKAGTVEGEDADPMTFRVVVAWSGQAVAIQVSHLAGSILPPPEPEKEEGGGSAVTNVSEQVEFFENLSPSLLGLEGASMSEYELYAMDGWSFVNEEPCRQINVYYINMPAGTNRFQGTYFISGDLQRLYSMDKDGNIVNIPMD